MPSSRTAPSCPQPVHAPRASVLLDLLTRCLTLGARGGSGTACRGSSRLASRRCWPGHGRSRRSGSGWQTLTPISLPRWALGVVADLRSRRSGARSGGWTPPGSTRSSRRGCGPVPRWSPNGGSSPSTARPSAAPAPATRPNTISTAPHLVAAFDHDSGAVLGQLAVTAKSNEIPAVRTLLAEFDLAGVVVTVDAMHTQTDTAQLIVEAGGDYVFTVKGNQPTLYAACKSAALA